MCIYLRQLLHCSHAARPRTGHQTKCNFILYRNVGKLNAVDDGGVLQLDRSVADWRKSNVFCSARQYSTNRLWCCRRRVAFGIINVQHLFSICRTKIVHFKCAFCLFGGGTDLSVLFRAHILLNVHMAGMRWLYSHCI